ncbi:MAG: glycosyltransferase [Myxococcales bacterium]|nr:glycosyltransferase [Myxococcales bacterium]
MEPVGVVQVVHSLEVGGMERVAAHLAMHLGSPYKSLVICLTIPGHFAPQLEAAGIEVIALNKKPGKDFGLPGRLAKILRERRIRIVHAHNSGPMFTGTWAGLLARSNGIIVTDHSRYFPERPTVVATEMVLSRLVNEIVSVSEHNKQELVKRLHWPEKKITVIPNGVEEISEIDAATAGRLREEFGLTGDMPTLLTMARLEKQKNIGLLIQAMGELRKQGLDCRLIVGGEGAERETLERLRRECQLEDRVFLPGWRLDAAALYRVVDIFALPSDWEGLPMSILEAMSASLPILATDVGDVSKAVITRENGLLVTPRDLGQMAAALAELVRDADKRRRFGVKSRDIWQQHYSVKGMARRYEELYARYA